MTNLNSLYALALIITPILVFVSLGKLDKWDKRKRRSKALAELEREKLRK